MKMPKKLKEPLWDREVSEFVELVNQKRTRPLASTLQFTAYVYLNRWQQIKLAAQIFYNAIKP
jgi:hypothetical protein